MDQRRILWPAVGLAVVAVALIALWPSTDAPPEDPVASAEQVDALDPREVYDPARAGEDMPQGYRQILGRDQIAPVYDPVFVDADGVDWPDDALVIGVTGAEDAKAYPVSHLNNREMVIDDIEGIPILVTW
jgi:hypothetical protein